MCNQTFTKKLQALLFLLCFFHLGAMAQIVRGTVSDEAGEPVIGAAVQVQGTRTGDVTDLNGKFSVEASSDATLIISYLGFVTETVRVNGRNNIQVTLKEDVESLNDVVVIGYGTQKKKTGYRCYHPGQGRGHRHAEHHQRTRCSRFFYSWCTDHSVIHTAR